MALQGPISCYGIDFDAYMQVDQVLWQKKWPVGEGEDLLMVLAKMWHEESQTFVWREDIGLTLDEAKPALDLLRQIAYEKLKKRYPQAVDV